jgi:hypothetical protein
MDGMVKNGVITPIWPPSLRARSRAKAFGTNPNSSMAFSTLSRVSVLTLEDEFNTRETVAMLTEAIFATSYIVGLDPEFFIFGM